MGGVVIAWPRSTLQESIDAKGLEGGQKRFQKSKTAPGVERGKKQSQKNEKWRQRFGEDPGNCFCHPNHRNRRGVTNTRKCRVISLSLEAVPPPGTRYSRNSVGHRGKSEGNRKSPQGGLRAHTLRKRQKPTRTGTKRRKD